jgi:N-methylhydantoinase A
MSTAPIRIGIDIGGTFTDIVAVEVGGSRHAVLKVPSTPDDLIRGMESGLVTLLQQEGWDPAHVDVFIHGSTIATNTIIERTGARTGLITTEGFRDVLEVARTERPPADLYNLFMDRPAPLVPRRRRIGVRERITARGKVEVPLDEAALRSAVERLLHYGVDAIAVCFLNSYANAAHERRAREVIAELSPDTYVALSSEINPQYREYERCSTTVVSAYVGRRVSGYVGRLTDMLKRRGFDVAVNVMQASGGLMTPEYVKRHGVRMILSGPAGGVLGALAVGESIGADRFVTVDMGGTSTDVAVAENGVVDLTEEHREDGLLVRIPMLEIATIGAGGGGIAWLDSGGVLRVGPRSAGADPGPACYGQGGTDATVTDANVVLGYIDPDHYLGGSVKLDRNRAEAAVSEIADALRMSVEEAALGITRVTNANMVRAIKRMTTQRGRDPRDYSLVAFGGAGGLHGGMLVRELGMRELVVPMYPGVLSACGLVSANLEYHYTATVLARLEDLSEDALVSRFSELEQAGLREMSEAGIAEEGLEFRRLAKLRYRKQRRDLRIAADVSGGAGLKDVLTRRFADEHFRRYGYATDEPLEVMELHAALVSPLQGSVAFEASPNGSGDTSAKTRVAYIEGVGRMEVPVLPRSAISQDTIIEGPAIIEQYETNVVVLPEQVLFGHQAGVLLLSERKDGSG